MIDLAGCRSKFHNDALNDEPRRTQSTRSLGAFSVLSVSSVVLICPDIQQT